MSVTVTDVEYRFGKQSKIVQGVKGNQVPQGAVYGGNGSFRVNEKPEIIIYTSDGKTENYYGPIKTQTTRQHVTERYARQVCSPLVGQEFKDHRAIAQAVYDNL